MARGLRIRRWLLGAGIFVALALLAGCDRPASTGEPDSRIKVVATIPPLADMVARLGGEKVSVEVILPSGADPHTFDLSPSMAKKLTGAQLVVMVGAGLDNWAAKFLEPGDQERVILELGKKVPLLPLDHGGGHAHGGDPHFWLDPVLVKETVCAEISACLTSLLPGEAGYFAERLNGFQAELDSLDREISLKLSKYRGASFISVHGAWEYFGRRYGLHGLGSLEEVPGKEASPDVFRRMVDRAREANCKVIICRPGSDTRLAEMLAEEIGGKVVALDPLGGRGLPGREDYISLMKYNVEVLEKGLADE